MANPQPTDSHLRLANTILDEFIMRDFSKRQRAILDFILRLSWSCSKKYAIIKNLCDFELCGVSKTKIKEELKYLKGAQIIGFDYAINTYWLNKDFEKWQIPPVKGIDRKRLKELISLNIDSQNGNFVPEKATKFPKKGNNVPKKGELLESGNIDSEPIKDQPITNIITSINNICSEFNLSKEFVPIIKTWVEYKKVRNEDYKTEKSLQALVKKLLKIANNCPNMANELIENSMANNWKSIQVEIKNNNFGYPVQATQKGFNNSNDELNALFGKGG